MYCPFYVFFGLFVFVWYFSKRLMESVQGINFKGQNYRDNVEILPSLLSHTNAALKTLVRYSLLLPFKQGESRLVVWGVGGGGGEADCLGIITD